MNYQAWEASVPAAIREDVLWSVEVYRLALFIASIGWNDVAALKKDFSTRDLSNQLYRSLGSISANIAEGYSRGTNKERAHFYEYALGSAREARDWYFKAQSFLPEEVLAHRLNIMRQIVRLLLVMVQDQRGRTIREEGENYDA